MAPISTPAPNARPAKPVRSIKPADASGLGPLFRYIWRNSRRQQIAILLIVLASQPFYFLSLDLPRTIVNDAIQGRAFTGGKIEATLYKFSITLPAFLGGGSFHFPGLTLDRLSYLLVLSGVFMALVLINGAFRYVVNMQKGKLGERLLRRLRLDLFTLLLRLGPDAIRTVKPSEAATIIKDEVEPIGGFVGDAFIQPAFLGGQALTALAFIIVQSPLLGILAGGVVLAQGVIIPRLRREQLRLGRERQIRSRALAGHIGEVVDGMSEVGNHGTSTYERVRIAGMLDRLFWIRYDLYGRKFMVKFINSVLAQVTPFLFYSIGGYFALRGSLDIGQLVAVIAAYRDLPPPVKELIDWDQQRLDVEVKYQQILEQFAAVAPPVPAEAAAKPFEAGAIEIEGLRVRSPVGDMVIEGATLTIAPGTHALLVGGAGDAASTLSQVLGRRIAGYDGQVRIGGQDLASLPASVTGAGIAYFGPDTAIFHASVRDNILYSLRRIEAGVESLADPRPVDESPPDGGHVDYEAAGAGSLTELEDVLVDTLHVCGVADAVFGFGLGRRLEDLADDAFSGRIITARQELAAALASENSVALVEPFQPDQFNRHATLGENLFFGALSRQRSRAALLESEAVRSELTADGLWEDLADLGLRVAGTMVEIFADLARNEYLFERFSFFSAADLPLYQDIVARSKGGGEAGLTPADQSTMGAPALGHAGTRHRLGVLTQEVRDKIVAARGRLMRAVSEALPGAIEFYDPERVCLAAPLRDNLLFGRIDRSVAGAEDHVMATLHRVVREGGLERDVYRLGLDQQAGPGGRLLAADQRSAIGLARCLIKQPRILILDQPGGAFVDGAGRSIVEAIRLRMQDRTVIVALRQPPANAAYDLTVTFAGRRIQSVQHAAGTAPAPVEHVETADDDLPELQALRAVPMFATVDTVRLKLIAFTSERVAYAKGQILFREGDHSDAAYIILDGTAEVYRDSAGERVHLSWLGRHDIVGEMGVIADAGRSATVAAASEVVALRLAKDVFLDLLSEIPLMALAVMRDQIKRLGQAEQRFSRAS